MTTLIISLCVAPWVIVCGAMLYGMLNAPVGREDENGFTRED